MSIDLERHIEQRAPGDDKVEPVPVGAEVRSARGAQLEYHLKGERGDEEVVGVVEQVRIPSRLAMEVGTHDDRVERDHQVDEAVPAARTHSPHRCVAAQLRRLHARRRGRCALVGVVSALRSLLTRSLLTRSLLLRLVERLKQYCEEEVDDEVGADQDEDEEEDDGGRLASRLPQHVHLVHPALERHCLEDGRER